MCCQHVFIAHIEVRILTYSAPTCSKRRCCCPSSSSPLLSRRWTWMLEPGSRVGVSS